MNPDNYYPSIYIGHGAPTNILLQTNYRKNLERYASESNNPDTIVIVSAHWEQHLPLSITSSENPTIIYDYYGFPEEMYKLEYDIKGNPLLASRIKSLLDSKNQETILNPNQGIDHGAWIPLKMMYPNAEIPIIQLSIPIPRSPKDLFKIGSILKSLRKERIQFMGSGNLVHNLSYVFQQMHAGKFTFSNFPSAPVDGWAQKTDDWIKEHLNNQNYKNLLDSSTEAPFFKRAAPTTEHFDPLYFVLGTLHPNEGVSYIHEGFEGGSISMRSFQSES